MAQGGPEPRHVQDCSEGDPKEELAEPERVQSNNQNNSNNRNNIDEYFFDMSLFKLVSLHSTHVE